MSESENLESDFKNPEFENAEALCNSINDHLYSIYINVMRMLPAVNSRWTFGHRKKKRKSPILNKPTILGELFYDRIGNALINKDTDIVEYILSRFSKKCTIEGVNLAIALLQLNQDRLNEEHSQIGVWVDEALGGKTADQVISGVDLKNTTTKLIDGLLTQAIPKEEKVDLNNINVADLTQSEFGVMLLYELYQREVEEAATCYYTQYYPSNIMPLFIPMCYSSKNAHFEGFYGGEYLSQKGQFTLFSIKDEKEMKEVIISTLISNKIYEVSDLKGMTIIPRLVKSANNQEFYYRLNKDCFTGYYRLRNIHAHRKLYCGNLHKIQMMYMSLYLTLTKHRYRIHLDRSHFNILLDNDPLYDRVLFFPYLPYNYSYSKPLKVEDIERYTNTNYELVHKGQPMCVKDYASPYKPPKFDQTWISDKVFNDKASKFITRIVNL